MFSVWPSHRPCWTRWHVHRTAPVTTVFGLLASVTGKLIMRWRRASILRELTLRKQSRKCLTNFQQTSVAPSTWAERWNYTFQFRIQWFIRLILPCILCPFSSRYRQSVQQRVEMWASTKRVVLCSNEVQRLHILVGSNIKHLTRTECTAVTLRWGREASRKQTGTVKNGVAVRKGGTAVGLAHTHTDTQTDRKERDIKSSRSSPKHQ